MRRLSSRHVLTSAALFLTLAGRPLLAVGAVGDSTRVAAPTDSTSAPAAGPRAAAAAVGLRVPKDTRAPLDASNAMMQQRQHRGTSAALMIVGASAIVLGLLVGDDAGPPLIVGGAIVGGIGLFRYLR